MWSSTFETFFDDEYTLKKLSTEAYIRDPRFEAHGAAVKWSPNTTARWYDAAELRYHLGQENWSDVFLIAHHNQFDGYILSHHFSVRPRVYGCTLSMARLLLGNHISVSLDSVRSHYAMPAKRTPYHRFKGLHWHEMPADLQHEVAEGAVDEVESIFKIFGLLSKDFPTEEYTVVDQVIRMFANPVLRGDLDMLAHVWESESGKKQERLAALGVTEAELQSADMFAAHLRAAGVEPEYKQGKNDQIYAFAKTDDFMRGLLEHDDERVRTLAEARLGVKSTLLQTRAETLGWTARRGPLPVYLRYSGAGTLRVSGGGGDNWLNFKRGSAIRRAIMAPEGYVLAPIDASQIECRCLHYLAGGPTEPVIEKFRKREDVYVDVASRFYGEIIYKPKPDDPRRDEMEAKRGMGKQGRLMCGYGAAGPRFKATAKAGLYGPPVEISLEDSNAFVQMYRDTNPSICAPHTGYWAQAGRMLARLAGGDPIDWGPLHIRDHRIYLPNGCPLIYDTLEFYRPDPDEAHKYKEFEQRGFWRVKTRQGWKTMWGSKLVQNICEAVSRVIVSQAMIRIVGMGYRVLNWPYDELLVLIPKDGHEVEHAERCRQQMLITPSWLPDLPLDAEVIISERYAK